VQHLGLDRHTLGKLAPAALEYRELAALDVDLQKIQVRNFIDVIEPASRKWDTFNHVPQGAQNIEQP
jgi:hypothetical protein